MRRRSSPAGNPVLIGAVTILAVIVAVFLSYNANSGLPFVPTYELKVDVPSGANLSKGNEVRIGGARVGAVSDIGIKAAENGATNAVLTLKLDKAVEPLPKDSTVIVRPKSLLGLKYVEITRGKSEDGYAGGDTMPLESSRPPQVEFDELVDTFDEKTRQGIAGATTGFGTALAGRGESLNQAIGSLGPLLENLLPVMRNLSDPDTGLKRLVRALGATSSIVAPAALEQADLFVQLDATFSALSEVRPAIQESISEGPGTLDQSISSFRLQRPFLRNTANLMNDLQPGARALRGAAPILADAFRIGRPTLLRTPAFDARLEKVLVSLQDFAEDPIVPRGVASLTEGVRELRPTLDYLAPAQTKCNYIALWMRNVSDLLSVGDAAGTWQRFIIIATPQGPNAEGIPSSAPPQGPTPDNYLRTNPYPNTFSPGQADQECEAGNEKVTPGQETIGNLPGVQSTTTEGKP